MRSLTGALVEPRTRRIGVAAAAILLIGAAAAVVFAFTQEGPDGWPREISVPEAEIVVYQPQPDSMAGDRVRARAAVAVTPAGSEEAAFGTVWFGSRLATDRDTRMAEILELEVLRVGFPNAEEEKKERLAQILEEEIPKWDIEVSMDRLLTSLDLAEKRRRTAENLNNAPPKIIVSFEPAILVMIEGEPRLQDIEGSDGLMRIINTPFNIVFDRNARRYYLYAGEKQWYGAPDWKGPWELTSSVPSQVASLAPLEEEAEVRAIQDSVDAQVAAAAAEAGEEVVEEEVGPPPELVVVLLQPPTNASTATSPRIFFTSISQSASSVLT